MNIFKSYLKRAFNLVISSLILLNVFDVQAKDTHEWLRDSPHHISDLDVPIQFFNNNDLPSDLTGSLEASVSFAQSQIMPSKHGIDDDVQPYLTALRASLIMVKPKRSDLNVATPLRVTAIDNQGRNLGTKNLNPPSQLPKQLMLLMVRLKVNLILRRLKEPLLQLIHRQQWPSLMILVQRFCKQH